MNGKSYWKAPLQYVGHHVCRTLNASGGGPTGRPEVDKRTDNLRTLEDLRDGSLLYLLLHLPVDTTCSDTQLTVRSVLVTRTV